MHHIEVDQSGKIEQTQWDTVLAFANDICFTLLISASVKRDCQRVLRARGVKPGMITIRLFVAGLFLLVEEHLENIAAVTIDTEYSGREGEIKGILIHHILEREPNFPVEAIRFRQIGKKSRAHKLAWEVYHGIRQPDKQVTVEKLLKFC